jgi:hypothetical protein
MVLIPDSQNPDGKNHSKLVCRSGVYGTNIDVLRFLSYTRFIAVCGYPHVGKQATILCPAIRQRYFSAGGPVVNILFDGTGHYDALFLNVILLRQPR